MALYEVTITAILEADDSSELRDSNGQLTPKAWDDLRRETPELTQLLSSDEVGELIDLGMNEDMRGHPPEDGLENALLKFPNLTYEQRYKLTAIIYRWLDLEQ